MPAKINVELLPGQNAIAEVLEHAPDRLESLVACRYSNSKIKNPVEELVSKAKRERVEVSYFSEKEFSRLLGEEKHQGAVGLLKPYSFTAESILDAEVRSQKPSLILILDQINDSNNLGSIFRLAAAAGVSAIFTTKNNSAQVTPTVRRVSMGSTELLPWSSVTNLAQLIKQLKESEFWVYGSKLGEGASNVFDVEMPRKLALVLGSEESGMRRLTADNCDMLVQIPMQGRLESLNVSQAASVLVFEVFRQWRSSQGIGL